MSAGTSSRREWARAERSDLRTLLLAGLVVPAVWWLLLGWDGSSLLAGNDAFSFVLQYRDLLRAGGEGQERSYLSDAYGGSGSDAYPVLLFYPLWAWLGLSPVLAYDLSLFAIQVLFAFLGLRTARDLAGSWRADPRTGGGSGAARRVEPPLPAQASALALLAFAPFLGWRLGWGHQVWIAGLLVFSAAVALLAASRTASYSLTLLLVASVALVTGLSSPGQQLVLYGLVFGGPLLLWVGGIPGRGAARRAGVPLCVGLAALAVALPRLWPTIEYATGPDAARSLGGASVVYSYTTATWRDWWSSLSWGLELAPSGRRPYLLHETNYPLGPLLLLLALVPWSACRGLALAGSASLLLVLVLGMDRKPLSDLLLAALPPLGLFRAPARSMTLLVSFLPAVAIGALLFRTVGNAADPRAERSGGARSFAGAARWMPWAAGAVGGALLLALPPLAREASSWALALGAVGIAWRHARGTREGTASLPYALAALLPLGVASVTAFRERLLPFTPRDAIERQAEALARGIRRLEPRLEDPLVRAIFDHELAGFRYNTGWALDVATLDGYWVPPRRHLELEAQLRGVRYRATRAPLRFGREHAGFEILRNLYNVCCSIDFASGDVVVSPLGPTPGPAWFSARVAWADDSEDLVSRLQGPRPDLALRETLWRIREPGVGQPAEPASVSSECAQSRIVGSEGRRAGRHVARVRYRSAGDCPATVALNYLSHLRGWIERGDGSRRSVELFPSYGALTGAILPAGEGVLSIEAPAASPRWGGALQVAGAVAFLVACSRALRLRRAWSGDQPSGS